MLAEPDGTRASFRELAAAAGVGVATLKHYFGSREGLVAAVLDLLPTIYELRGGVEDLAIAKLFNRFAKRCLDLAGAAAGLVLAACGKNMNVNGAAALDSGEVYATAAVSLFQLETPLDTVEAALPASRRTAPMPCRLSGVHFRRRWFPVLVS